jgi:ABC-type thiamin/hydroxymethylpyrimidine transport system permease subunit
MLGFIYCTLGYHFQILRGDELKLRIHLESLNAAFTTTLVAFFILIFVFINFSPKMLNWILLILSVILICSYLLATQFIRDKYQ